MHLKRILGCLLGCAIGDALGMPFEEMPLSMRKRLYGNKLIIDFVPGLPYKLRREVVRKGSVTDDTEMTLVTTESIVNRRAIIVGDIIDNLFKWLRREFAWLKGSAQNRNIGPTTREALERYGRTRSWGDCGGKSHGCGAAIRVSPIAICSFNDFGLLRRAVFSVARLTHKDLEKPLAEEGALCVAASIRHFFTGGTAGDLINHLYEIVHTNEFKGQLDKIRYGLKEEWTVQRASEEIGTGASYLATEVVCLAIYIFMRYSNNFKDAVVAAINVVSPSGADTDSIGAIVGTLSGSYLGVDAIPLHWRKKVEYRDKLKSLSKDLFRLISSNNGMMRFDEQS